jgi:uncharacterized damage-inducible protein DinB
MKRLMGVVVIAAALSACTQAPPPPPPAPPPSSAVTASIRIPYEASKGFIIAAAEQFPEAKYSYQPTKDVRTFGQIVGHIADGNYLFCKNASTEQPPQESVEKTATKKADLQKALAAAFAYCDRAFAALNDQTGAAPATIAEIGDMKTTRLGALSFNGAHNYEHYGNLVTYMRLNKMVPPSSQRAGGN